MKTSSSDSIVKWLLIGLAGIFLYELVKQLSNSAQSLQSSLANALQNAVSDILSIPQGIASALGASPGGISNAITGEASGLGTSIENGISSAASSAVTSGENSIWNLFIWLLELPFTIIAWIFSGLTGQVASTAGGLGSITAAPASYPVQPTTADDGSDPTIANVPQSGANTISNGGSSTTTAPDGTLVGTGNNFTAVNGAGASSSGFQ